MTSKCVVKVSGSGPKIGPLCSQLIIIIISFNGQRYTLQVDGTKNNDTLQQTCYIRLLQVADRTSAIIVNDASRHSRVYFTRLIRA